MIVWLASFPRSGNTLLRNLLKQTMGLISYSDDPPAVRFSETASDLLGERDLDRPWPDFYRMACDSEQTFLVKTHRPPVDGQDVIYVVRDGRSALWSYAEYHRCFLADRALGLTELVLGGDFYGGWSDHFENWRSGSRKLMLVRYEELVDCSPELLAKLATFVRHEGPKSSWKNQFDWLHQQNPHFFRAGHSSWKATPEWNDTVNGLFFCLHGQLMTELSYATAETVSRSVAQLRPGLEACARIAYATNMRARQLESTCGERQRIIDRLAAEVRTLEQACKERLDAITTLEAAVKRLSALGRST